MRTTGDTRLYLWAALLAVPLTAVLHSDPAMPFARFFGPVPPIIVVAVTGAVGYVCLRILQRIGWATGALTPRPLGWAGLIAACFGAVTIVSDYLAPFPETMNAALPGGALFYPVMGLVVEILFHLLPLTLLVFAFHLANLDPRNRFWLAAMPVAFLEPLFQVVLGGTASPPWQNAEVFVHLLIFNLVQMALLQRGGFAAAFAMRLAYYLIWHIIWGWARLDLLF